jgi:hypothetical protein
MELKIPAASDTVAVMALQMCTAHVLVVMLV